ncbi:MAG: hypothetical protein JWO82_1751 [Akkermansiaceae bacterium]|nr:hypothetical protein [Akkermansiaceae bacterium]
MKTSLTITTIIVALFVFFGGNVRQHLSGAREKHDRIQAEARARSLEAAAEGNGPTHSQSRAAARAESQKAREAKARETARKLMGFGNDEGAISFMGRRGDPDKQLEYQEGLAEAAELDSVGMKVLVGEIAANGALTDEIRARLILELGSIMSMKAPLGAIDLLLDANNRLKIPTDWFQCNIKNSLRTMAINDPKQAMDWIQQQAKEHPELANINLRGDVVSGIAQTDRGLAFSKLGELGLTKDADTLYRLGCCAGTPQECNTVLAAMRHYRTSVGSEEERQFATKNAMAGMGQSVVYAGYDSVSQWLESAKLSPDEAAGLASGFNTSVIKKEDAGKWIDWISGNVPADHLGAKVDELMKFWTENDYRAAGTWLDSAPAGPAKEAAVRSYASTVASTDPAAASQWALTLPAGEERTGLLQNICTEWRKQDPDTAARFARDHGIGE